MDKYFLFLMFLILTGCQAEYKDVSKEAKYSNLINTRFQTLETLLIHGVNLGENKEKEIDIYKVSRKPGTGGRYIISKIDLKSGSKIEIEKVLRCTNCAPSKIIFLINILSENLNPKRPIELVDLSVLNSQGQLVMDPAIFLKQD